MSALGEMYVFFFFFLTVKRKHLKFYALARESDKHCEYISIFVCSLTTASRSLLMQWHCLAACIDVLYRHNCFLAGPQNESLATYRVY